MRSTLRFRTVLYSVPLKLAFFLAVCVFSSSLDSRLISVSTSHAMPSLNGLWILASCVQSGLIFRLKSTGAIVSEIKVPVTTQTAVQACGFRAYVWRANSPINRVYLLNNDDIERIDMCEAWIELSNRPNRVYSYWLIFLRLSSPNAV